MIRRVLLLLALAALVVTYASAQTAITTVDRTRVLIEYDGPKQLSNDFMVMRVRIVNRTGDDRTWAFAFNSLRSGYAETGRRSRFELAVEDGHDRQFELLVPLSASSDASWLQMIAYGEGVVNAGQMEVVENTWSSSVAISTNATLKDQAVRDQLVGDPSGTVNPFVFPAALLPADWRAYSSLSVLWLASDEWKQANAGVRRALTGWVAGGGCLVLVEPGDRVAPTVEEDPVERYGMGSIVTLSESLSVDDVARFEAIKPGAAVHEDSISWVSSVIEPIETHRGFLSLLLLGYLVLAAPVNLFLLSPRTKRMRLFWTMPVIALGASAAMAMVILLQDGVGGSGYRSNFVYLPPGLNRELIVQEQVSRTGAILRRSFEVDEAVVITSLPSAYPAYEKPTTLESRGGQYSGDWFRTRSIQAQRLACARATRARIELVGTDPGATTIQSSIEVPLETLYYRAPSGDVWVAHDVAPGRPVALQRSSDSDYERFWREVSSRTGGPAIRHRTNVIRGMGGAFLAVASHADTDIAIDTLTSINWTDGPLLYAGHIQEAGS